MEGEDPFDGKEDGRRAVPRRNPGRYVERERQAVVERLQQMLRQERG